MNKVICMSIMAISLSVCALSQDDCNKLMLDNNHSLVKSKKSRSKVTSHTHIEEGIKQFPKVAKLSYDNFDKGSLRAISNSNGDFISISSNIGTKTSSDSTLTLTTDNLNNSQTLMLAQKTDIEIANNFATKSMSDGFDLSPDSKDVLVKMILSNEKMMEEARLLILNEGQFLETSSKANIKFELTNHGVNRFFWYKPNQQDQLVPARILDINPTTEKIEIFLEHLNANESGEYTSRSVRYIEESELASMIRDQKKYSKEAAQKAFYMELSPIEVQTTKLAHQLNVKLFGFSNIRRMNLNSRKMYYETQGPLRSMNSPFWMAIEMQITQKWGSLDFLRLPSDPVEMNVIDLFSRQDPKFIIERFYAHDFHYSWVITEDGALKVMPKLGEGHNLHSPTIRLASGRKIYAGGDFTINGNGSINILFDSFNYQQLDRDVAGSRYSFLDNNPNVEKFVSIVFYEQANLISTSMEAAYAREFRFEGSRQFSGENPFGSERSYTSHNSTGRQITWNQFPVDYQTWLTKTKSNPNEDYSLELWAHYVLKTDSKTSFKNIRKSRNKLAVKFHPDKSKIENSQEIQVIINNAYDVFKEKRVK